MNRLLIITAFFSILLSACSKRSLTYLHKKGVHVDRSFSLTTNPQATDTIEMQYLGCGGFYIRQGTQAIMVDPFFSHQSFMRIGRSIALGGKIKSKPKEIEYGKRMIKDSIRISDEKLKNEVKGIFSAHGHYDHLMDVPYLHHEWFSQNTEIFANSSAMITCANVVNPSKLHDLQKLASIRNQKGDSIEFSNGQSSIRVYPIFADHNPHSRNIKLFAGSAVKTPSRYKNHTDKTSVNDWLEGQTLSFLIDFLKGDSIYFRVFIQSSTCQFPNGLPPESLLQERNVDLAVLGIASYHFSENTYPCEFLKTLKPAKLMFIHWEDFFRKLRQKPKAVKTNDVARLFTDVFSNCKMDYTMPLPGSVITIRY
jgi:hypothetical protein